MDVLKRFYTQHLYNIILYNCVGETYLIKKNLTVGIIILFTSSGIVPLAISDTPISGKTIYVDDDGGKDYTRIQDAIDNATAGDTVYVFNGTYYENIVVNKTINLIGENRSPWNASVIDGGGIGDVVHVSVDRVNISGFTINNSGHVGIEIRSKYNNISGNVISSNEMGIRLDYSNYNHISDNLIQMNRNFCGICFHYSNNNTLSENTIISNSLYGIHVDSSSNNNVIYHNNFNNTRNAYDTSTNMWYNDTLYEGNYWSDYFGKDADDDGIGDAHYSIHGGISQDFYPLMNPFGKNPPNANFIFSTENLTVLFDAFSSFDRDGTVTSYEWNFGDNSNGAGIIINHSYILYGTYNVTLTITDNNGYQDSTSKIIDLPINPNPPEKPTNPSGPMTGKFGTFYQYSSNTIDLDGDQISYLFDWGDDTDSGWTEPIPSGQTATATNAWTTAGSYQIRVKARDIPGFAESEWSDTLVVSMPKNKAIKTPFIRFLEQHPLMFPMLRQLLGL